MSDPTESERAATTVLPTATPEAFDFEFAEKKMLACRLFIQGCCEKGENCLLYHPSPENMDTAITSPPLPPGFGTDNVFEDDSETTIGMRERRHPQTTGRLCFAGQGRSVPTRFPAVHSEFSCERQHNKRDSCSLDRRGFLMKPRHQPPRHFQQPLYGTEANIYPNIQHYSPPLQSYDDDIYYEEDFQEGGSSYDDYGYVPFNDFDLQSGEPESSSYSESDTLFSHIEWSQFLAPGQLPPPLVAVPEQYDTPQRKGGRNLLDMMKPAENSDDQGTSDDQPPAKEFIPLGKMNVKQEFKYMVERVAAGISELTAVATIENTGYDEEEPCPAEGIAIAGYPESARAQ